MPAVLLYLQIILAMLIHGSTSKQECPCYCDSSNRMNCANQRWDTIPTDIPHFVTVINFQINGAQHIKENTFHGLKEMVLLRLDSNKIHTIEPKAFFGMPNLNELVLNNNQIRHFDERMVDPMSPLKRGIKLDTNQLTKFPLNLLKRHRMSISVINNMIQCDCFTVIPSDLKEFVYGECHSSTGRKTITSMTYTSADCQKCEHHRCAHGSCYLDNDGNASCQCFEGFSGESCEIDGLRPVLSDDIIPSSSMRPLVSPRTTSVMNIETSSTSIVTVMSNIIPSSTPITTVMSNIEPSSSVTEQQKSNEISERNVTSTRLEEFQPSTSLKVEMSSSKPVFLSEKLGKYTY